MLRAGTGKVCITPPVGIDLSGFGARDQPSTGVLDGLYARGLYLEDDTERFLWLHCDLLGLSRDHVWRVRRRLARDYGLVPRQILVSATHTHAGPATQRLRGCGTVDPAYIRALDAHLFTTARDAMADPEVVELRFAEGECHLGIDRRGTPSAHTDPQVPVLAFARSDGTWVAVLINYAMHNVALSHENRRVSADVAGAAAQLVRERLPGGPVAFVTNGACANVNPPRLSDDPSVAYAFGRRLGAQAASLVQQAVRCADPSLESRRETVAVPLEMMTAEAVEAVYRESIWPDSPGWLRQAMCAWREETRDLIARDAAPDHLMSDVQAFRIGPASFAALGAEVFSRMADDLRARHGARTYVVGYAGGNLGYLPPREAYAEGGYEIGAYRFYGTFNVAPGGFELLRDRSAALLGELGRGS